MYTVFISFLIVRLCFARLFGKQLRERFYYICLFLLYFSIFLNSKNFLNLDNFFYSITNPILSFTVFKNIKLGFIILLGLIALNSNKFINKFADFYLLFLLNMLNKIEFLPNFIITTFIIGSFIGRQISIYLDLSVIKTFMVTFFFGCLLFSAIYKLLLWFHSLARRFAKPWGNAVFTYLFNKASPSVKQKIKPDNSTQNRKTSSPFFLNHKKKK